MNRSMSIRLLTMAVIGISGTWSIVHAQADTPPSALPSSPTWQPPTSPVKPHQATPAVVGKQVIVPEPAIVDFGVFSTSETKEAELTLRNSSDAPVTIRSARGGCGCTTTDFKPQTVLGPGETTSMVIKLRGGPQPKVLNKDVTFTIDGFPPLRVPVQGQSISFVKMTPPKLGRALNSNGAFVLESIDGHPFVISRVTPDVLVQRPVDAKPRHELVIDWDRWKKVATNGKLQLTFTGYPKCRSMSTTLELTPEDRTQIQSMVRQRRTQKRAGGKPVAPSLIQETNAFASVRQGRVKELTQHLEGDDFDVDQRDSSGMTLLCLAAKQGHVEIMEVLIKSHASVDMPDRVKRTPLMYAGISKNPKAIQFLIDHGAEVNARDLVIGGPLAWAAGFGNAASVQILVDEGAELETLGTATGFTPLTWASGFGDFNSIPILLAAGANIEARDMVDGATPLMHAARTGQVAGMKFLIDGGANIKVTDRSGRTPLMAAAGHSTGSLEKIRMLVEHGAATDAVDSTGKTALDLARSRTDGQAAAIITFLEARQTTGSISTP